MRMIVFGLILALPLAAATGASAAHLGAVAGDAGAGKSPGLLLTGGKGKGQGGKVLGLPPGQAKKWARGQYLPKTIVWAPAPAAIIAKLKPVPPGHRYVVIDGEVLLIALATGLILDVFDVI